MLNGLNADVEDVVRWKSLAMDMMGARGHSESPLELTGKSTLQDAVAQHWFEEEAVGAESLREETEA